jgi:hypothetical protein
MVGIVSLWERRPNAGPPGKPWPAITRRGWVNSSNISRLRSTATVLLSVSLDDDHGVAVRH